MRIRKNKKLTASMIWSTAASSSSPNPPVELLQAHVCVVNRSPWDSPPSPPPLQVNSRDDDSYNVVNGSLACDDCLPPDFSNRSVDSMKISIIPDSVETESVEPDVEDSPPQPPPPPKRRPGRPRKNPVAQTAVVTPPSSNPEFYYYSGFGPRWGKRRGGSDDSKKNMTAQVSGRDCRRNNNNNNSSSKYRSCSSSSSVIEETDDELDFIDDDDDDDDDEDDGGRKRTRKPVKARSLKSLIM